MTAPSALGAELVAGLLAGTLDPNLIDIARVAPEWRTAIEAILTAGDVARRRSAFNDWCETQPGSGRAYIRAVLEKQPRPDPEAPEPITLPKVWSHADLMHADLPEQKWLVPGLVPDASLVMLGGKKKRGKSWICIQLAQAVAGGVAFLGRSTVRGDVLYFCLEDGERRLRSRLEAQQSRLDIPGLHYVFELAPLNCDGFAHLRAFIARLRPKLLILDTLAAAKTGKVDENAAGDMADLMNELRTLAQQAQIAIVVVAHHKKGANGDDPGDDLRGSSAVGAASDVNLGLYRTDTAHVLKAEGRDIPDTELRIAFDDSLTFTWQLVGDARELARQEGDAEVIGALRELGEADASAVASFLGKTRTTMQEKLKRMADAGALMKRADRQNHQVRMLYSLPNTEAEA
jgi:AAA domain-containing protein